MTFRMKLGNCLFILPIFELVLDYSLVA